MFFGSLICIMWALRYMHAVSLCIGQLSLGIFLLMLWVCGLSLEQCGKITICIRVDTKLMLTQPNPPVYNL